MLCHACVRGAGAQEVVRLRCAVAADDVDGGVGLVQLCQQCVQQVELARIVVGGVLGAVVAEEVVELVDAFLLVLAAYLIDHVDVFAGVQVMHTEAECLCQAGPGCGRFGDGCDRDFFCSAHGVCSGSDGNGGQGSKGDGKGTAEAGGNDQEAGSGPGIGWCVVPERGLTLAICKWHSPMPICPLQMR